jgi:putative methanogenesis marker protein 2
MIFDDCSTTKIAEVIRDYEGVKRKHAIGEMVRAIRIEAPNIIASFGEDAAVIENGDDALLLAADGIWSRLMEADPYWAGYCSVLVNIHDIAAMGGKPLAMVDVFSISDTRIQNQVLSGMHDASLQFGVPIVGGHLHPDTPYSVIDVAILGIVKKDEVIYSHTAQSGDAVIIAIDLEGRVHPSCALNWDSVTMKPPSIVRDQVRVMESLGRDRLVTAGKEVSGKGAMIELELLPKPDLTKNFMTFEQWIRSYPGMGFVLTAPEKNISEICHRFGRVGMTANRIGWVNDSRNLRISFAGEDSSVFDFSRNGVMRLFSDDGSCIG